MFDNSESFIPLNAATKHLPGRPHRATLWRIALRGSHGIRLRTVVCGGRRFTTLRWIEEYLAARTAAANKTLSSDAPRADENKSPESLSHREQEHERQVEAELDSLGIRRRRPQNGDQQ